jgi:hypothetical protein
VRTKLTARPARLVSLSAHCQPADQTCAEIGPGLTVHVHVHRCCPARLDRIVKGDGVLPSSGHGELCGCDGFDGFARSACEDEYGIVTPRLTT